MKSSVALRLVAELSAEQWGMFTTAQARARSVDRVTLSRLAASGHTVRLAHGVYRDAGAPEDQFEAVRSAWLSIHPEMRAEQRVQGDLELATPVSGASAADLHGIGDLRVDVMEFTSPTRRQSQREQMRYRIRDLAAVDVTMRAGLPVTTLERTIADLVAERHDLDNVASAVRDASRQRPLDEARLAELLAPSSARHGLASGDGAALWSRLAALAKIDIASAIETLANDDQLGPAVAHEYAKLEAFARAARKLEPSFAQQAVAASMARHQRLLDHVDSSPAVRVAEAAAARDAELARMQTILRTPAVEAAMRAARHGW